MKYFVVCMIMFFGYWPCVETPQINEKKLVSHQYDDMQYFAKIESQKFLSSDDHKSYVFKDRLYIKNLHIDQYSTLENNQNGYMFIYLPFDDIDIRFVEDTLIVTEKILSRQRRKPHKVHVFNIASELGTYDIQTIQ